MYYSRGVSQNSTNSYQGGGGVENPDFYPYVLFGWSLIEKLRTQKFWAALIEMLH